MRTAVELEPRPDPEPEVDAYADEAITTTCDAGTNVAAPRLDRR